MSNYDHIWNIQMFLFYERFFLVLWVIRAAAVHILRPFIACVPKMAHLIIVILLLKSLIFSFHSMNGTFVVAMMLIVIIIIIENVKKLSEEIREVFIYLACS